MADVQAIANDTRNNTLSSGVRHCIPYQPYTTKEERMWINQEY